MNFVCLFWTTWLEWNIRIFEGMEHWVQVLKMFLFIPYSCGRLSFLFVSLHWHTDSWACWRMNLLCLFWTTWLEWGIKTFEGWSIQCKFWKMFLFIPYLCGRWLFLFVSLHWLYICVCVCIRVLAGMLS